MIFKIINVLYILYIPWLDYIHILSKIHRDHQFYKAIYLTNIDQFSSEYSDLSTWESDNPRSKERKQKLSYSVIIGGIITSSEKYEYMLLNLPLWYFLCVSLFNIMCGFSIVSYCALKWQPIVTVFPHYHCDSILWQWCYNSWGNRELQIVWISDFFQLLILWIKICETVNLKITLSKFNLCLIYRVFRSQFS